MSEIMTIEIQDKNANIYYPHTDSSVVKYEDSNIKDTITNINSQLKDMTNEKANLVTTPQKTKQALTYYVNPVSGNDANTGLTESDALKTITKAINLLPKNIEHNIRIQLAQGTYNETPSANGFWGTGGVTIKGAETLEDTSKYKINSFTFSNCGTMFYLSGISVSGGQVNSIYVTNCKCIQLLNISMTSNNTEINGIGIACSIVKAVGIEISNKKIGIVASNNTKAYLGNVTGSGNGIGVQVNENSTVGKYNFTLKATTEQAIYSGGAIR